ncbi:MAG TPA: hypothetical protein VKG25_26950 [Bryobacteraceae bacterium]|nr:hypothetical protein [Bryobacteraceae bacterium]
MSSLKQLFVLTVFGALAGLSLNAQIVNLKANIPFDFHAGKRVMPAGEYQIHGEGSWFLVHPADGDKPVTSFLTFSAIGDESNRGEPRIEFKRYGNTYFLATIWNGYAADGRELAKEVGEKKLAKEAKSTQTIIVARK